ncbi:nucleotide-diphospho-sugar transferase [Pedobacter polaris]|uniref:Nucleotide-diphospho-sugar transferase n=1 Tax=Pedobacter polaris TaxID=2571273 RepID=A0A4U1CVM0_9SPHI|nr:nucleotide-diphospho-sugar transferase [Pedobacter polaris]TKC12893.1 nucleotide-diphospho-sugar transferase [Pedobacter polaris]
MLNYHQHTPILLLVFNRPELTVQVLNRIKAVKPKRLYIAADGPRNEAEAKICNDVRALAMTIDWDCELKTLFREHNLGCGKAVSEGITWFFEQEEMGIVLEDDCLPEPSFFAFCSTLLNRFKDDETIGHISGSNFQDGIIRGDGSYYYSDLTHVWGWASWRRVWKDYDFQIKTLVNFDQGFTGFKAHQNFALKWKEIFTKVAQGEIDTWDYQYAYLNLSKHYLSIMPNVNLVQNIGIGEQGTHTFGDHPLANKDLGSITEIIYPSDKTQNVEADIYTQQKEFYIPPMKKKNVFSKTWKAIKKSIRNNEK